MRVESREASRVSDTVVPTVGRHCGQCGLPISETDHALRHYGFSVAHLEYRCHELERMERERLTAELEEARQTLREAIECIEADCDRVTMHIRGNDQIMERWKRVAGISPANPSEHRPTDPAKVPS